MVKINKVIPKDLEPNRDYIVRARSVNTFGNVSDWSDSLYIDPTTVAGIQSRITIDQYNMSIVNGEGILTFGAFGKQENRQNLVKNPSFEDIMVALDGWDALGNTWNMMGEGFYGSKSVKAIPRSDSKANIGMILNPNSFLSVSQGEIYSASAHVLRTFDDLTQLEYHSTSQVQICFTYYNSSDVLLAIPQESVSVEIPNGEWARIKVENVRIPQGVAKIGLLIRYAESNVYDMLTSEYLLIDAVMIEKAPEVGFYFDGDTVEGTTSWDGTPHFSSSTFYGEDNYGLTVKGNLYPDKDSRVAKGIVGYNPYTVNYGSGVTNTVVDLNPSVTFTAEAGRSYKITAAVLVGSSVANDKAHMMITNGSNVQVAVGTVVCTLTGLNFYSIFAQAVVVPGAGSVTYKMRGVRSAGTGTLTYIGTVDAPRYILVEDIGVL